MNILLKFILINEIYKKIYIFNFKHFQALAKMKDAKENALRFEVYELEEKVYVIRPVRFAVNYFLKT